MKKSALTIAVLAASMAGTAIAATNPTAPTATSSSGDVQVTIARGDGIMISGLADFTFGVQATAPVAPISDTVCVYATAGGEYTVTATTANTGGTAPFDFQMADASGSSFIGYQVQYETPTELPETLVDGVASGQKTGGDQANLDCSGVGGDNGQITVTVDSTTFTAAAVGLPHGDTLTVLVALN